MKLEAFSEVSNLVRHLEGLEARREQIASAHVKGVDSFLIELRKFNDDGGYYDCHAYMQAHDDAAAITVEELFEVLRVHVASKIEGVKAKLRDLGVNLDEGKQHKERVRPPRYPGDDAYVDNTPNADIGQSAGDE